MEKERETNRQKERERDRLSRKERKTDIRWEDRGREREKEG